MLMLGLAAYGVYSLLGGLLYWPSGIWLISSAIILIVGDRKNGEFFCDKGVVGRVYPVWFKFVFLVIFCLSVGAAVFLSLAKMTYFDFKAPREGGLCRFSSALQL